MDAAKPEPGVVDKPFTCLQPDCGKKFARANILRNHVNATHNNLRVVCSTCRKAFRYRNDLRQHVERVHQGKRPFKCTHEARNDSGCACGTAFATRGELNRHQRKAKGKSCSEVAVSLTDDVWQPQGTTQNASSTDCLEDRSTSLGGNEAEPMTQASRQAEDSDLIDWMARSSTEDSGRAAVFVDQYNSTWSTSAVICRSMPLTDSLASSEQCFLSIKNYITGAFEARIWISHGQDSHCISLRCSKYLNRYHISVAVASIVEALRSKQYAWAKSQLSRLCKNAIALIQGHDFYLLWELLDVVGTYYDPKCYGNVAVSQSLDLIVRHCLKTSRWIHGPCHPLTRALNMGLKAGHFGSESKEEVFSALRVIQTSYERILGADHRISLWANLRLLKMTSAPPAMILPIFMHWEQQRGLGDKHTRLCLKTLLSVQRHQEDYEGLHRMVEYVRSRLHHIEDAIYRLGCAFVIWESTALAYMDTGQWNMAATTIQERLSPVSDLYYGEASSQTIDNLLHLKKCLERAGDWVQLENLNCRLQHLLELDEANDNDDNS